MYLDDEVIKGFAVSLRAKGKQPATVESYCRDARHFLSFLKAHRLPVKMVEPATLVAYQDHLSGSEAERENSVRRKVIGVRQFFRYLTESRHISSTPFDDVPIPSRNDQLPGALDEDKVQKILALTREDDHSLKATRDAAVIRLLAYEGLKATELIGLRWVDYYATKPRSSLKIRGQRSRTIELATDTAASLDAYRERFERMESAVLRNDPDAHLVISFKGRDGALPMPQISRHGLKFMIYELGERVGIKHLNTELLRHFAVTHQLTQGRSPEEIMQHFGLRRLGNIAKHMALAPKRVSRSEDRSDG